MHVCITMYVGRETAALQVSEACWSKYSVVQLFAPVAYEFL